METEDFDLLKDSPYPEEITYSDTDDVLVLSATDSFNEFIYVDQSRLNTSKSIIEFAIDKLNVAYVEDDIMEVDNGHLITEYINEICQSTQWISLDHPSGTGDHEKFRFVVHRNT